MNNIVEFDSKNLRLINHANQLWFTSTDIAKALNYSDSNSITLLFSKHKDEFDGEMSQTIETKGSGNLKRMQRIFNREGAWLIGMFARTPKAAEFRRWVLKVLGNTVDNVYPCGMDSRVKHGNDVKGKEITGDKPVEVVAHTRSLPSGRKEIVLSEKAKAEIGGIVKNCLAAALEAKRPGISGLPKKKLPVTVFSRKSNEACCMDCRVKPDNDSSLAGIGPKMTEGRGCPNMMETLSRNWPDNDGREIKPEGDDKKSLTMTAEIDYNKLSAGVGGWVSMTLMSARYDDLKREAESLRRQAELCEKQAAETWKSVKKIESALGI